MRRNAYSIVVEPTRLRFVAQLVVGADHLVRHSIWNANSLNVNETFLGKSLASLIIPALPIDPLPHTVLLHTASLITVSGRLSEREVFTGGWRFLEQVLSGDMSPLVPITETVGYSEVL